MGRPEHVADPKVNPRKMGGRMHLRVDGTANELGLCVHEDEEVPRVVERIPVRRKPLRSDVGGLEVLERDVLDDSILKVNAVTILGAQKEVEPDACRLKLIEQGNVPIC
jgi:hypothetical protein